MTSYNHILNKLNRFTKKYYTKVLIKGILMFMAIGFLFFLVTLGVEYLLWLGSIGRLLLLLTLITVGMFLAYRFIITPLFLLFRIRKGISERDASLIIGKHFPEVSDRLYNLLDLAEDKNQSELLLASIEQRSKALQEVPFVKAINLKDNLRYTKYLALPILLIGLLWASGNLNTFFASYERVVNYAEAYEPPAPFRFELLTPTLNALQDKSYTIFVTTIGSVRPDAVNIAINGSEMVLQKEDDRFKYVFSPPLSETLFHFSSGEVQSRDYLLKVLETPVIEDFEMELDFPEYTLKENQILKSSGNAIVPEGTLVSWKLTAKNTERIKLVDKDTSFQFVRMGKDFSMSKSIMKNYEYGISTSNINVKDYERLDFQFKVIKDAYPTITVEQIKDSLSSNVLYYVGESSDDYKIREIKLVYYPTNSTDTKQQLSISSPNSNYDRFYYTFPSGLNIEQGIDYSYYFEVLDNDGIRNGKTSKSEIFSTVLLDADELSEVDLKTQQSLIKNLDGSLEELKKQKLELKSINQEQKEKNELNFNDQSQVKNFLNRQKVQENLMQKFSKQLKDNLNKKEEDNEMNQMLQERLERQEKEALKSERLLEELSRIADKIDKEELTKRLEDLGKKQTNSERSLEQLLELTKRYYVTEKASQLAKELDKLSEKQEILSDLNIGEDLTKKEQKKLNNSFDSLVKDLNELQKDNAKLKKPLKLKIDKEKELSVKENQENALEEIDKHQGKEESSESEQTQDTSEKVKHKQKAAAQKIKEMSEDLGSSAMGGSSGSTITEDAEMLRQILDNLITFSFKQEALFEQLEDRDEDLSQNASAVRNQKELRGLFEHVDDSLFALSLRRVELSEFVNEQITDVYYNIDKSLEDISENQFDQGISHQKYVLNASNKLADFLVNILDNMQESMKMGAGSGSGSDDQLPDIIKGQGELKEKMEGAGKAEGKNGEEGEGKEGSKGKDGEKGTKGNQHGENGEGKSGQDGKGNSGEGNGSNDQGQEQPSENELRELYDIYKEQQRLRNLLEKQLNDMMYERDRQLGKKLLKQMEDFENDLLQNGITKRAQNKVNTINYELLKLENAALKKGKKRERESTTGKEGFRNAILSKPMHLDNYRNEIEILDRQALPLRQNFQIRVKEYFKNND